MTRTRPLAGLLFAACLTGCGPAPDPSHAPLEVCEVDGVTEPLLCGRLQVPENRDAPGGRTISLAIVVLPALSPNPNGEPWFDIEGGPGDRATDMAAVFAGELSMYRRDHDVVLVDQRGTIGSGSLYCPELDDPDDPVQKRFDLTAVEACRDRFLAEGIDLTRYTTSDAVEDLEDVRAWLGYERVNLWSLSYGTSVAQLYAKRYSERVRTVTLWGALPPSFHRPLYYARDAQRAWELLVEECRSDPSCRAAYPDLALDLESVLARLAGRPARLLWRDPVRNQDTELSLDAETFAAVVRSGLFHTGSARRMPAIVMSAARGDFEPFLRFAFRGRRLRARDQAESMLLAATCAEETLRMDLDAAPQLHDGTFLGAGRLARQHAACRAWPVRPPAPDFADPLRTALPVLLVVGDLDPVTPPSWSESILGHLENGELVVVPLMGHLETGMVGAACLHRLIVHFADQGGTEGFDRSCLAEMRAPLFEFIDLDLPQDPQPAGVAVESDS